MTIDDLEKSGMTDTYFSNLKPCPFCGNKSIAFIICYDKEKELTEGYIQCCDKELYKCHARSRSINNFSSTNMVILRESWNTRI